jgi:hypothetical protein
MYEYYFITRFTNAILIRLLGGWFIVAYKKKKKKKKKGERVRLTDWKEQFIEAKDRNMYKS